MFCRRSAFCSLISNHYISSEAGVWLSPLGLGRAAEIRAKEKRQQRKSCRIVDLGKGLEVEPPPTCSLHK
jgi:hypothetical protein